MILVSYHNLGHVHMGFQVPSATHVSKYQLLSLKEINKIWLIIIKVGSWLFYAKIFAGLGLRVGPSFVLDPTRNASPKLHLQKLSPCMHPCEHPYHTWDLGPVHTGPKS